MFIKKYFYFTFWKLLSETLTVSMNQEYYCPFQQFIVGDKNIILHNVPFLKKIQN